MLPGGVWKKWLTPKCKSERAHDEIKNYSKLSAPKRDDRHKNKNIHNCKIKILPSDDYLKLLLVFPIFLGYH